LVANPITACLYTMSLILVYVQLGRAYAVGASDTIFMINAIPCVLTIPLIGGLYCAVTGKIIIMTPGYRTTRLNAGVYWVTETKWNPGGYFDARVLGLYYVFLSLFLGVFFAYIAGFYRYPLDANPAPNLFGSGVLALVGAMVRKARILNGNAPHGWRF